MAEKHYKNRLRWITVVVWMGIIFFLSHQPGNQSSELSSGITDSFIDIIQTLFPFIPIDAETFHYIIRKGAHFTAYFVLGVLVIYACRLPGPKGPFYAWFICVVYAMTDEFHQLFILGRSGEIRDVLIDSSGAAAGVGFYVLISLMFRLLDKKHRK